LPFGAADATATRRAKKSHPAYCQIGTHMKRRGLQELRWMKKPSMKLKIPKADARTAPRALIPDAGLRFRVARQSRRKPP